MKQIVLDLQQQLKRDRIALTVTEFHGFLSGMLCAGNRDESVWPLLSTFINDGELLAPNLMKLSKDLIEHMILELDKSHLDIKTFIVLNVSDIKQQIENLSAWTNHFLLGLGVIQLKLDTFMGEKKEAIEDLTKISRLQYSEEEAQALETPQAILEILDYIEVLACYLNSQLTLKEQQSIVN